MSDRVSNLSDDLARKRALLEEKRRKLLELEESYMHEFGEEEEGNLAEDLPVEDIELNDKENSSSDRNVVEKLLWICTTQAMMPRLWETAIVSPLLRVRTRLIQMCTRRRQLNLFTIRCWHVISTQSQANTTRFKVDDGVTVEVDIL